MHRTFQALLAIIFGLALVLPQNTHAQNAIVTENGLTGNPQSEWDITGAGDLTLQGFATDMSVNAGSSIGFKVKGTLGLSYTIDIYRLGWYNGNGARKVASLGTFVASDQATHGCALDAATGLVDCGTWTTATSWSVPAGAVSGIYIAKLTYSGSGGSSHIIFVVRKDGTNADLMFKTSDATWQAYNVYGGNSLYVGTAPFANGHAAKVSYNRPLITRAGGGGGGVAEDGPFNAEYPMLRWLERNGYDVTYRTDVDMKRDAFAYSTRYKVLMSVGHDEYWSAEARSKFEAARTAGVHLAFFSGNEVYWKTRFEASIDGANTSNRTLVCYKEGTLGENVCNGACDPTTTWTGLWRDGGAAYPSKVDGNQPENALTGQISWAENDAAINVPATMKDLRFWRNTSVAGLSTGGSATMTNATIGYEWDPLNTSTFQSNYPGGRVILSNTDVNGKTHQVSLYRYQNANHAFVFGAGTVQWSWGLDDVHDRGNDAPSADMQQATVNLFADMGVQPGTLQNDLTAATASSDVTAPTVTIASPANGSTLTTGTVAVISGTSADASSTVAGVEVSVDGGTTWTVATGTTNWSYNWTPSSNGTVVIKVRAFDDLGNLTASGSETSVSVTTTGPVTLFGNATPNPTLYNDGNGGIVLGLKFLSTQSGFITAIRFFKPAGSTASHLGALYKLDGTLLSQVAFTNESSSGWQQANFGTPVAITANTVYMAVYYSDNGDYVANAGYFLPGPTLSPPLRALRNGENGPNGLYDYAYQPKFPTQTYQGGNYWADVVFANTIPPDVTPPSVTSTSPSGSQTDVSVKTGLTITMSEELNPATVSSSTILFNGPSGTVSSSIVYNTGLNSITVTPVSDLAYSTSYTVTVKGGSGTVVKDLAGNAVVANYVYSFTTSDPPAPYSTGGQGGPVLVIGSSKNPFSIYATEILRAEGWNAHKSMDIANLTSGDLNNYDIAILGEVPLTNSDVTNLTNWVNAGGTLITFRPDVKLSSLLGITTTSTTMSDKYLLVNNAAGTAGAGIVNSTIQYHGAADLYTVTGSNVTVLATLYSSAASSTAYPAVTSRTVGSNGGQAIAFTYDLAKSIVLTHQGNPAWAGQKRDGTGGPPRSDDMYYGMGGTDYVDLNKVAIPQADEQQRLLNNIMMLGNYDKKPVPRFWFLPKGLKAAVVMTGDDHGNGGTTARFTHFYNDFSTGHNSPTDLANWDAIRYTSYIYPNTSGVTDADVSTFQDQGFEVGLHLNTGCAYWTQGSWNSAWNLQWSLIKANYPSILAPVTNRTHCIAWSDYASQPKLEAAKNVRLDVNYYFYPANWVQNRAGMFTGSGNPMRFADIEGTQIDAYQVVTQMTDESGQTYPGTMDALLGKATGAEGYYGVFCANMHTDLDNSTGADAIVASAMSRNIPVVSAKQMLAWLDGRNNSSFDAMSWSGNQLTFTITQDVNAVNLKAMLPTTVAAGTLVSVTRNGSAQALDVQTIKGIDYAFFDAQGGNFVATYASLTPVTLLYLKGTPVNNTDVKLDWATASESNNKGFDVQRSTDGNSWTSAGFVAGAGNSSIKKTYTFTDKNLPTAKYYYRLKQVDFDGKSSNSNIINVSLVANDNFLMMQNYPNPTNGTTSITYHVPREVNVRIALYDQYGRMVRQLENVKRTTGSYSLTLDASSLAKGIYYYKMEAEEFSTTKKMIVN